MGTEERAFRRGDRVVYVAKPVFDEIIKPGDTGGVVKVEPGWVFVLWSCGVHSVTPAQLRHQAVPPPRQLQRVPGDPAWALVGKVLPSQGRERDPYWEQGSHPDLVEQVWDRLGGVVPAACRAQANGSPVLAHPANDRIFAKAHGTQYALRLVPADYEQALAAGARTAMTWSGGSVTDLREVVGEGWIWGGWDHKREPAWLIRSYEELGLSAPRP